MRQRIPMEVKFWAMASRGADSECWEWRGAKCRGYGVMSITSGPVGGPRRREYAHRVSWEINLGPVGGSLVLHRCDNPPCVNPAHLFLGTSMDNARDRQRKDRGTQRITVSDRIDIVTLSALGARNVDLARAFGVSQSHVSNLVRLGWSAP